MKGSSDDTEGTTPKAVEELVSVVQELRTNKPQVADTLTSIVCCKPKLER